MKQELCLFLWQCACVEREREGGLLLVGHLERVFIYISVHFAGKLVHSILGTFGKLNHHFSVNYLFTNPLLTLHLDPTVT